MLTAKYTISIPLTGSGVEEGFFSKVCQLLQIEGRLLLISGALSIERREGFGQLVYEHSNALDACALCMYMGSVCMVYVYVCSLFCIARTAGHL